jgi:hypothetical protein
VSGVWIWEAWGYILAWGYIPEGYIPVGLYLRGAISPRAIVSGGI